MENEKFFSIPYDEFVGRLVRASTKVKYKSYYLEPISFSQENGIACFEISNKEGDLLFCKIQFYYYKKDGGVMCSTQVGTWRYFMFGVNKGIVENILSQFYKNL